LELAKHHPDALNEMDAEVVSLASVGTLPNVIKIAISVAAYKAIAKTLPLGSVAVEPYFNAKGERTVWLEPVWVDRLAAMRGPSESYSDVILRIAGSSLSSASK
jgi:hypothetical protein